MSHLIKIYAVCGNTNLPTSVVSQSDTLKIRSKTLPIMIHDTTVNGCRPS